MSDIVTFKVTEATFVNIYSPLPDPLSMQHPELRPSKTRYGLSIPYEQVPEELLAFVPRRPFNDGWVAPMIGTIKPRVIVDRMDTLLQCATAANIPPDMLFRGIPLEIAVQPFEYESDNPHTGKTLRQVCPVLAIRADVVDVTIRYNELCEEYWR